MSNKNHRIDLSKYHHLDIKSVALRAVNADDMLEAASRCVPPNGSQLDPNMFGIMLRQHLLIQSIAEVDDVPCNGPCLDFLKWNQRTRDFVGTAYDFFNTVTDAETTDFMTALANPSGVSASGSDSAAPVDQQTQAEG